MRFDILTALPEVFQGWLHASLLGRAQQEGRLQIVVHALRDYARDRHRTLDDYPFGGGAGMVMKPEPFFEFTDALREACQAAGQPCPRIVLLTPQGRPLEQTRARALAGHPRLVLLCGRYEGIDERVRQHLVDEEISLGDYVLTGGEVAAMALIEAVARWVPGVLGSRDSAHEESFSEGLLEYPHYTRPAEYRGWAVPAVLLSGHHERIRLWRRLESLRRTLLRRPDLLRQPSFSDEDRRLLARVEASPFTRTDAPGEEGKTR